MSSDDSGYRLWRGESQAPSIQSLGGKARAANMTPEERTKAARHAATKGARKLGKEGRRLRALKGAATRKARAEAAQKWGSSPAVEREIDALANTMRKGDALQDVHVDALGRARDASGAIVGRLEVIEPDHISVRAPMVFVTPADDLIITSSPGGKPLAIVDPTFEAGRKDGHRLADNFVNTGSPPKPPTYGAAIPPGDARRLQFNLAPSDRNAHLEASHRECAEAIGIARPKRREPKPGTLNARVLSVMRRAPGRLLWRSEDIEAAVVPCQKVGNALSSLRSAGHVVSVEKPGSRREKLWRLA